MAEAPYSTLHDVQAILRRLDPAPESPHVVTTRADRMLASLVDLPGAVRVADHLATMPRDALPPIASETGMSPLRARVERKLLALRDELALAFRSPFEGRRAAPDAPRIASVLRSTGAFPARTQATIAAAARTLGPELRERFEHELSRARQRVRWTRVDITAELRALGPHAARLEQLDAVVARATERESHRLEQALFERLDDALAKALAQALAALPEGDVPSVGAWVERGGVVERHVRALFELCSALVDHEIDALTALVDAAWAHRQQEIDA